MQVKQRLKLIAYVENWGGTSKSVFNENPFLARVSGLFYTTKSCVTTNRDLLPCF